MAETTVRFRPKIYPPPEFPQKQPKLFARMPPAAFLVILGILGAGLALRQGLAVAGWPGASADLLLGMAVGVLAFALVAYAAKVLRRPGVLAEDMRVLPGRAGLAAAGVGGMAAAAGLAPIAPRLALPLLVAALALHGVQAVLLLRQHLATAPATRAVSPADHLGFAGFIVGGHAAALLGQMMLAQVILWLTLPVAVAIWGLSARQFLRRSPPAPLRPLLAIHVVPASLFASVAALTGQDGLADVMMILATLILLGLTSWARWLTETGFSPIWGAFTFPLAAYAGAALALGGVWTVPGTVTLIAAFGVVPVIAWRVLKLWPPGTLAARTNAAEA